MCTCIVLFSVAAECVGDAVKWQQHEHSFEPEIEFRYYDVYALGREGAREGGREDAREGGRSRK